MIAAPSGMSIVAAPASIDQLARRFPLVPRHRPALPPLPQLLAESAATARNKAALVASNCGRPDLARQLCWQHHHHYADRRPWTARTARFALEPLVNLARLHIRAGHPDKAVQILEALLTATSRSGVADIEGHSIDLGATITTHEDRDAVRRWIWTVTLAEGVRALARTGRWDDALTHAERHHGIGATLLDGRQIAVLAHALRGDHTTARRLLTTSVHAEEWQASVAYVLELLLRCGTGTVTLSRASRGADHANRQAHAPAAFRVEIGLAVAELADEQSRPEALHQLSHLAAGTTDASVARAILTHPAHRHLPEQLLDHLATVRDDAHRLDQATSLHDALAEALRQPSATTTRPRAARPATPDRPTVEPLPSTGGGACLLLGGVRCPPRRSADTPPTPVQLVRVGSSERTPTVDDNTRAGRVTLDEAVYRLVTDAAARRNLAIEDLVEVTLLAAFGGEEQARPAQAFLRRTEHDGSTMTQADLAAALVHAMPGLKAVGIRLGARTDYVLTSPFPRTSHGADYAEPSSPRLWAATRGIWVVGDNSNAAVAYRAGEPLDFFVNLIWSARDPETKRRWATYGLKVTQDGSCVDPETEERVRAATAEEMAARQVIFGHRLWMPLAARNPIVRLWT